MNFGVRVKLTVQLGHVVDHVEYRNVTEIHMRYNHMNRIAFESDIHCTGRTWHVNEIAEMEVFPETEKKEEFYGNQDHNLR